MRRIAVCGHRDLTARTAALVYAALRAELAAHGTSLTGLSCLAEGADQIFARAVADAGGRLEAIVPAASYRDGLPPAARTEYDRLLALAATVHRLPFAEATPQSYMSGGELMVDRADELYAIWDGRPARGCGGTADVVAYARRRRLPVLVIWPPGAMRESAG